MHLLKFSPRKCKTEELLLISISDNESLKMQPLYFTKLDNPLKYKNGGVLSFYLWKSNSDLPIWVIFLLSCNFSVFFQTNHSV